MIHNHSYWSNRYDLWYSNCPRPTVIIYTRPIRWYVPMPEPGGWNYSSVETVALNLEHLTRDIYEEMARVASSNPNQDYAQRLMRVLAELVDASENFTDAVYDNDDYYDTLNDLFYLESKVDLAESTLDGYSKSYLVNEEMKALRYYVNELLWVYRYYY